MKELLDFFYNDELMIQQEIAQIFGVCQTTISNRMVKLGIRTRPMRGGARPGHLHRGWNGGKKVHHGRIYHWMPDHPNADKNKYVEEGRLVIESIMGDFLPEDSVVHHFNADPGDNRPENLMYFDGHGGHLEYHHKKRKLALGDNADSIMKDIGGQ